MVSRLVSYSLLLVPESNLPLLSSSIRGEILPLAFFWPVFVLHHR